MTASVFTPTDDTLAAKIAAFKSVYRANEQMQASMDLHSSDWQDRLGEKQDVIFLSLLKSPLHTVLIKRVLPFQPVS